MRFIKSVTTVAVWLFLCTWLAAGELPQRIAQWQSNVCRVRCQTGSGFDLGSGVYLGRGLVLTAHHVVRDSHRIGGRQSISLHGGGTYQAKLVGWNQPADVAFLRIDIPTEKEARGVLLAAVDPQADDLVWRAGYGGSGQLLWHQGKVRGFSGPFGHGRTWFDCTPYSVSGDSGGPVFNDAGELIGNLWGSSPGDGTTTAVLASTLSKSLGGSRQNLVDYHVSCFGKGCYSGKGPFYWLRPGRSRQPSPGLDQPAPGAIRPPAIDAAPPLVEVKPPASDGIQKQITDLQRQIAELQARPGAISQAEVQAIVGQVLKQRPGTTPGQVAGLVAAALARVEIPVQIRDRSGAVIDSKRYKLGDPIKLDFDTRPQRGALPGASALPR